jgi:hypothetical protein
MFDTVQATAAERAAARPGDNLVGPADVVMDRAFTVAGMPDDVWPWLVQLGKRRAGWYLPGRLERLLPASRRAARVIDQRWQRLGVGDIIPDYGGRDETFEVAQISRPTVLVYRSRRGHTDVTWSISLAPAHASDPDRTRVFLRLRMAPVRHQRVARTVGELFDLLTVAGMAAGLRERLEASAARH